MSCWLGGFVMYWSSRGAVFSLGRKAQQFCEARFISLAHGTVAIGLNPFGMFPEQGFVHLLLKLNVNLNVVRTRLRRVRIHAKYHHQQATGSQCACVGFSVATHGATCPTSFEVEELAGSSVRGCSTLTEHFNSHDHVFVFVFHDVAVKHEAADNFRISERNRIPLRVIVAYLPRPPCLA